MAREMNPHVENYLRIVEERRVRVCEDQVKLAAYVRRCFAEEDIYTDDKQLEKYLSLSKYFPWELFPWEEFVVALHLCTYWKPTGLPRWPDVFCLIGRGAGKDGVIAFESLCLVSPYNGIRNYDVDICANVSEQATRPVEDVVEAFENSGATKKLKKFFYWTTQKVKSLKTGGCIRGRTNNPASRDGMRSGAVMYNEVHGYQNYSNVNVFTTSLGKKPHPRIGYFSSQGNVREGVLDDLLERSEGILNGEEPDNGLLPIIFRLNTPNDVHDPKNWVMANPSLPYLPALRQEIAKEYREWKKRPNQLTDFMTKRMGLPSTAAVKPVTEWDNIKATKNKKPWPDMTGWQCTVGIDYASMRDWASVDFHFTCGELRMDITHSWVCVRNPDLYRVKFPWQDCKECTPVDDVEISPELLTDYIAEKGQKYFIRCIGIDNFRYALMKKALAKIGFDAKERKNVKLIRPSDIMTVQPVIDSCFNNHLFDWADQSSLRWAANNTKLVPSKKRASELDPDTVDTGNFYYSKIEAKSRKTDPFMALVASMVVEDRIGHLSPRTCRAWGSSRKEVDGWPFRFSNGCSSGAARPRR